MKDLKGPYIFEALAFIMKKNKIEMVYPKRQLALIAINIKLYSQLICFLRVQKYITQESFYFHSIAIFCGFLYSQTLDKYL